MPDQKRITQLVAWAWAFGWSLISIGQGISDIYSTPNRGLTALFGFGFTGWAIGAAATVLHVRYCSGRDGRITLLSAAGWGVGALVAVLLGPYWLGTWNPGFFGLIAATSLGAAIGGSLSLPLRALSSPVDFLRLSIRGAIVWGVTFLVFQTLAFYVGYILMVLTVNPLVPLLGDAGAKILGWALPAGVGGFFAARAACRFSLLSEQ